MDMLPSESLRVRVSGNADGETYSEVGLLAAMKMAERIEKYRPGAADILDWGCGPGRVAVHLPFPYVYGCDPDPAGVEWCNANIAEGQFEVSGLYPPLPYEDESFDAIIAVSVMTHLKREVQRLWLCELARILRPGGVFVATVHGEAAANAFGITDLKGIQDHWLDPFMAGVLSADYYKTVLQSEAYTRRSWRQFFDIEAYETPGLELHDLVVCRKK
jgi:SAM-dependent methyltransferase